MTLNKIFDYLARARRELWNTLEKVPDEILARPLLSETKFHCLKGLIFHVADVADGWVNGDILRQELVQKSIPELWNCQGGSAFAGLSLPLLLDYWRKVEESTQRYLATLTAEELDRVVPVEDWPEKRFTVDGLLWHVAIHEMRHTAQICALLRTQGIKPPSLDLLFFLPLEQ